MAKKAAQGTKSFAAKRTINEPTESQAQGAPFNDQDPKRRLGNFGGAGEHPRQGSRSAGIVGQTKQKNRTDNRKS